MSEESCHGEYLQCSPVLLFESLSDSPSISVGNSLSSIRERIWRDMEKSSVLLKTRSHTYIVKCSGKTTMYATYYILDWDRRSISLVRSSLKSSLIAIILMNLCENALTRSSRCVGGNFSRPWWDINSTLLSVDCYLLRCLKDENCVR